MQLLRLALKERLAASAFEFGTAYFESQLYVRSPITLRPQGCEEAQARHVKRRRTREKLRGLSSPAQPSRRQNAAK